MHTQPLAAAAKRQPAQSPASLPPTLSVSDARAKRDQARSQEEKWVEQFTERKRTSFSTDPVGWDDPFLQDANVSSGMVEELLDLAGLSQVPALFHGYYLGSGWISGNPEDIAFDCYIQFVLRPIAFEKLRPVSAFEMARYIDRNWGASYLAQMHSRDSETRPAIDFAIDLILRLEAAGILERREGQSSRFITGSMLTRDAT